MIQSKLKLCAGCGVHKHIWKSHGKEKYCKECWHTVEKPKAIAPMSKKMKETVDEYSKLRTAFLVVHPHCEAKIADCTIKATDVHHKAGRGENHLKIGTWLAVCRNCHSWIELHPNESKELGFSDNKLN